MKTAIVTDSTVYLPKEVREKYNIHIVPLAINFPNESFKEEVTISIEQFYEKVHATNIFPKTAQPAIGDFIQLYRQLAEQYDEIVSIHLSSGISGTYNGALQAAAMIESINIIGLDSGVASGPLASLVISAAKLAKTGARANEIITYLEDLQSSMDAYFIVDDLNHLQKGGRLSASSALIGGLLKIKPILHMDNKKIAFFEKVRTQKKALHRVEDLLAAALQQQTELQAVVMHSNCEEHAMDWMRELQQKFPSVTFHLAYFGPVLATHLGEGALALSWMKK